MHCVNEVTIAKLLQSDPHPVSTESRTTTRTPFTKKRRVHHPYLDLHNALGLKDASTRRWITIHLNARFVDSAAPTVNPLQLSLPQFHAPPQHLGDINIRNYHFKRGKFHVNHVTEGVQLGKKSKKGATKRSQRTRKSNSYRIQDRVWSHHQRSIGGENLHNTRECIHSR